MTDCVAHPECEASSRCQILTLLDAPCSERMTWKTSFDVLVQQLDCSLGSFDVATPTDACRSTNSTGEGFEQNTILRNYTPLIRPCYGLECQAKSQSKDPAPHICSPYQSSVKFCATFLSTCAFTEVYNADHRPKCWLMQMYPTESRSSYGGIVQILALNNSPFSDPHVSMPKRVHMCNVHYKAWYFGP